jgi:hypothetical protein
MAQDVVINGTTYPAVETVALTDADGNTKMYHPDAVRHVEQTLTEGQKNQARLNIGAISNAVSDLVNYYKKSETYTQAQVNALVSSIPKFSITVVSALPTGGISDTTIYLVKTGADSTNLYTEYIFIVDDNAPSSGGGYDSGVGTWEKLGEQNVNLTGYATENWVNTQLTNYQPKGNYALKSEIPSVPVKSVNGKTGAVVLDAAAVGAVPTSSAITVTGVDADGTSHSWTMYGVAK